MFEMRPAGKFVNPRKEAAAGDRVKELCLKRSHQPHSRSTEVTMEGRGVATSIFDFKSAICENIPSRC